MWKQLKRIIKPSGAIVMTASQPFTSKLVMSNLKMFKYEWIWNKNKASGLNAKYQPLRIHESIIVFSKLTHFYNPIMTKGLYRNKQTNSQGGGAYGKVKKLTAPKMNDDYYPRTIINFHNAHQRGKTHPTQKPVALFEYLIKTYTNEGDTVLDFVIGSGTTAVACVHLNRNYIGIEWHPDEPHDLYFKPACKRVLMEEILRG